MGFMSALFPPSTDAQEAYNTVARREAVILDVRESHEWKAGHAPGARNIPLSSLRARLDQLAGERRYIAVCRSGSRSRSATAQLRAAGIEAVNLKGGMAAWHRAGLPLDPRNGRIL